MSRLVESIKIYNGRIANLALHETRMNRSRFHVFGCADFIKLRPNIVVPKSFESGLVKCRLVYSKEIEEISFQNYSIRDIHSLRVIHDDQIEYPYKWVDRSSLDHLYEKRNGADEILIVKNGLLTDAYYYNIVLQMGFEYFTPRYPLLNGVQRTYLINKFQIKTKDIPANTILEYDKIYLINAMTPLGKIVLLPKNVLF